MPGLHVGHYRSFARIDAGFQEWHPRVLGTRSVRLVDEWRCAGML